MDDRETQKGFTLERLREFNRYRQLNDKKCQSAREPRSGNRAQITESLPCSWPWDSKGGASATAPLHVEYAGGRINYGILCILSLFYDYRTLEYVHACCSCRVRVFRCRGCYSLSVWVCVTCWYFYMLYTGLTKRDTVFEFVWLRPRNTWIPYSTCRTAPSPKRASLAFARYCHY